MHLIPLLQERKAGFAGFIPLYMALWHTRLRQSTPAVYSLEDIHRKEVLEHKKGGSTTRLAALDILYLV